jgi:hypothetical protein
MARYCWLFTASQLKPEHYPRVEDSDKDKILGELRKFVGEKMSVIIIGINPQEDKLVFSEKATNQEERKKLSTNTTLVMI